MNFVAAALIVGFPWAQPPRPDVDRKEDVIYGRKFGTALTMDVYVPKAKKNGAGVIFAVSGGWFSAKQPVRAGGLRRVPASRLYRLRGRARQPAAIHDSRSRSTT